MAPFFMKYRIGLLIAICVLTIIAAIVNQPVLWTVCILCALLHSEMRFHEIKEIINVKDKAMGLRLIEGMRALTELCKNAFDHIKTTNGKVEKLGAKVGETMAKVHRLEQRGNVKTTAKTPFPPESWKKPEIAVTVKKEKKENTKE